MTSDVHIEASVPKYGNVCEPLSPENSIQPQLEPGWQQTVRLFYLESSKVSKCLPDQSSDYIGRGQPDARCARDAQERTQCWTAEPTGITVPLSQKESHMRSAQQLRASFVPMGYISLIGQIRTCSINFDRSSASMNDELLRRTSNTSSL